MDEIQRIIPQSLEAAKPSVAARPNDSSKEI